MYNFELFQKEFLTPLKRNLHFFIPPQADLQKGLTPLTFQPPPTARLNELQDGKLTLYFYTRDEDD